MVKFDRVVKVDVIKEAGAMPTQLHFADSLSTMIGPAPCIIVVGEIHATASRNECFVNDVVDQFDVVGCLYKYRWFCENNGLELIGGGLWYWHEVCIMTFLVAFCGFYLIICGWCLFVSTV